MGVTKIEILKYIFKSKDGASWNEVSEMLNSYTKDMLMALYENDMIEPHKNFMCGEEINTIEDGLTKLIDWYESEGECSIETHATLPIFDVSFSMADSALNMSTEERERRSAEQRHLLRGSRAEVCPDCFGLGYYVNGIYTPECKTCNGDGQT